MVIAADVFFISSDRYNKLNSQTHKVKAKSFCVCVCVCAHVNIGECGVTSDNKANNKRER